MSTHEEAVVFDCKGDQLLGILHLTGAAASSGDGSRLAVINVVGGPQYRVGSHRQFVITARHLARHGYPVLRFDYRGMGDSEGAPRDFESVDEDITAAIKLVTQRLPGYRVVLMGLCDAASAIMMYCNGRHPEISGIVVMNPWARSDAGLAQVHVDHYYGSRVLSADFWRKLLRFEVIVFSAGWEFLRNQIASKRSPAAAQLPGFIERMRLGLESGELPALLVLSGADLTAREFEALAAGDPRWAAVTGAAGVDIARFPDADHTFSSSADLNAFNAKLVSWLQELRRCHRGTRPCH